jgi:hypothetical protein
MTAIYRAPTSIIFSDLLSHLQSFPTPLTHPDKPHQPSLSDSIASLYLHPAIEALLHILNHDLPSAHFLVRHMQSPPAYEGMYVHGILHRIEGDFDNARAWYCNVCEWEGFEEFWGQAAEGEGGRPEGKKMPKQENARMFLDSVESLVKRKAGKDARTGLEEQSRKEIDSLLGWCMRKFGTEGILDAKKVWVRPSEEIAKMGQDQVSGEGGRRKF